MNAINADIGKNQRTSEFFCDGLRKFSLTGTFDSVEENIDSLIRLYMFQQFKGNFYFRVVVAQFFIGYVIAVVNLEIERIEVVS